MRWAKWYRGGIVLLLVVIAGCAASRLDEAKRQYMLAASAENPVEHYKASLEELDAAIKRDPSNFQAYALKGLIYRNLEDFESAKENLKIAEQGSYEGQLQWVPVVINLTYGDIFHRQAGDAIRAGTWDQAKNYQDTALQFFTNVINTTVTNLDQMPADDSLGITMRDLYQKAQARWAAAQLQMAVIAGKTESKERQSEVLREVIMRLDMVVESYPNAAALRYYLAEGYYKQAVTIQKTDAEGSQRLKQNALTQLSVCSELGLPADLKNVAAQLAQTLSPEAGSEIAAKILGSTQAP